MEQARATQQRPGAHRRPAGGVRRRLRSRWVILACLWLVQGVCVYLFGVLWILLAQSASSNAPLGELPSVREYAWALVDDDMLLVIGSYVAILTALQAVLLLPVRRPAAASRERGASLWGSVVVAGIAIAGVWMGAVLSVCSLIALAGRGDAGWIGFVIDHTDGGESALLVALLVSWAFSTPLVAAFCRSGPRDTALARLSIRILQGTAVEVVAIIPLDVMIRRKTDCYCSAGTFWALMLCGTVGLLMAGPAMLLTVMTRRRRRWRDGRCEVCGYDMTGLRNADRCPECGCGWAAAPTGTAGGNA